MTIDLWSAIERERRALADDLAQLQTVDWEKPTTCELWDVKAVAAHLVLPFEVSKPRFMMHVLRNRRDVQRTIDELTLKVNSSLSATEIIESLRANAGSQWKPPGATATLPLAEVVVHGQDIRRAVGLDYEIRPEVVAAVLNGIDDGVVRADYQSRISRVE